MRVVLVDDHAAFRSTARRILEAGGIEVVADVGDAAAALVAAEDLRPDVVLADVHLAGDDGLALAERVAALADAPAFVAMSAWDEEDVAPHLEGRPVRAFVTKASLSARALREALGLEGAP